MTQLCPSRIFVLKHKDSKWLHRVDRDKWFVYVLRQALQLTDVRPVPFTRLLHILNVCSVFTAFSTQFRRMAMLLVNGLRHNTE